MRRPCRITEPSTRASTPSILAISGNESFVPFKRMTEVREITRRSWILASRPTQFFGHPVGQVFLRGVARQVVQGQDCQGSDFRVGSYA